METKCDSCGATRAAGQEWCLQCGTAAPGSLGQPPAWRPLAAIAACTTLLLAGAGAAAYAALTRPTHKGPLHVALATVPAPTTSTPASPPPLPSTPLGTSTTPTPGGSTSPLPTTPTTPPKIPAPTPTPNTGAATTPSTNTSTTTATTETGASSTPPASRANPILLDTNAASTYNPYGYPASNFSDDPGLAIDGETGTVWTAKPQPTAAPHMAAGLLIDLHTAQRLGSVEVLVPKPGATVEVYGARGEAPPTTITAPAWTKLSGTHVLKKKKATIKLHTGGASFRYIVLWLTKTPPGAPQVVIDELTLYPPAA